MIIGLCGQSGSGKTEVAHIMSSLGFTHIDCDKLVKDKVYKINDFLANISAGFGKDVFFENGEINTKALSTTVFNDKNKLALLNAIANPYILSQIDSIILESGSLALVDAPTLFESGFYKNCDTVIGVIAEKSVKLQRLSLRDKLESELLLNRIKMQKSDEFLKANCEYIIENNGSINELSKAATEIANMIKEKYCG